MGVLGALKLLCERKHSSSFASVDLAQTLVTLWLISFPADGKWTICLVNKDFLQAGKLNGKLNQQLYNPQLA